MSLVESTIQNILPSISVILGDCIFDVIAGIVEYLLLPIIIVGGILWLFVKALQVGQPAAKPGNSGNATNKTGAQTTNAHGNRHTDLIATRALIQKWQNDGSISDAEFAKLSGLVSREQAALESCLLYTSPSPRD